MFQLLCRNDIRKEEEEEKEGEKKEKKNRLQNSCSPVTKCNIIYSFFFFLSFFLSFFFFSITVFQQNHLSTIRQTLNTITDSSPLYTRQERFETLLSLDKGKKKKKKKNARSNRRSVALRGRKFRPGAFSKFIVALIGRNHRPRNRLTIIGRKSFMSKDRRPLVRWPLHYKFDFIHPYNGRKKYLYTVIIL